MYSHTGHTLMTHLSLRIMRKYYVSKFSTKNLFQRDEIRVDISKHLRELEFP